MHRLITLGLTMDLAADFASLWTDDTGGLGLGASLLLAAAVALYRFVTPATGEASLATE